MLGVSACPGAQRPAGTLAAQSGRAQLTSTRTPGRVVELTEGEWLVLGCPLVQGWPEPQPIPPGLPGRVAPTGGPRRGCLLLPPGRLLVKTNPAERGPGVGEGRASARRNSISHHERARSQDRPREQRAVIVLTLQSCSVQMGCPTFLSNMKVTLSTPNWFGISQLRTFWHPFSKVMRSYESL